MSLHPAGLCLQPCSLSPHYHLLIATICPSFHNKKSLSHPVGVWMGCDDGPLTWALSTHAIFTPSPAIGLDSPPPTLTPQGLLSPTRGIVQSPTSRPCCPPSGCHQPGDPQQTPRPGRAGVTSTTKSSLGWFYEQTTKTCLMKCLRRNDTSQSHTFSCWDCRSAQPAPKGQEAATQTGIQEIRPKHQKRHFTLRVVKSTERCYPERVGSLHPWRQSKLNWTRPGTTSSG